MTINAHIDSIKLRDFSSAFSRRAFVDVLNYRDYSHFNWLSLQYNTRGLTYLDLLNGMYSSLSKNYRCEYVYKNELIKFLLKQYTTKNTVYFSEFRVGSSIADVVMFNGESKVFEIKTELDTPKRLDKQMEDYKYLFDKCYIVIPEKKLTEYESLIDPAVGIILMENENKHIRLKEVREATLNHTFDAKILMSCLRINEYKNIVSYLGYTLDGIPGYDLFTYCQNIMLKADSKLLKTYFLHEIKTRKNNTAFLRKYPKSLRQMMLSLNLPHQKANILLNKLNTNINQV